MNFRLHACRHAKRMQLHNDIYGVRGRRDTSRPLGYLSYFLKRLEWQWSSILLLRGWLASIQQWWEEHGFMWCWFWTDQGWMSLQKSCYHHHHHHQYHHNYHLYHNRWASVKRQSPRQAFILKAFSHLVISLAMEYKSCNGLCRVPSGTSQCPCNFTSHNILEPFLLWVMSPS